VVIGVTVAAIAGTIGGTVGLTSGLSAGAVAWCFELLLDIFLALPSLILALCINGVIGAGTIGLIAALAGSGWMRYARVSRAIVLSTRTAGFVEAAFAGGATRLYVLKNHILPHTLPALLALAPVGAANAILNASALSFLGLGVPPPTPEWGAMLSLARPYMRVAPLLAIAPGIALSLLVVTLQSLSRIEVRFRA
jgi:ABC-type dipeptide/oligopeptide/nickel transport system permease subunit